MQKATNSERERHYHTWQWARHARWAELWAYAMWAFPTIGDMEGWKAHRMNHYLCEMAMDEAQRALNYKGARTWPGLR